MSIYRYLLSFIPLLLLSACAGIPEVLQGNYTSQVTPAAVRLDAQAHTGEAIRWGGIILNVENLRKQTRLTVLAYPLDDSARPITDSSNMGRFLIHLPGFYEPANYEPKREITVTGHIQGVEIRKIGGYDYHYPLIDGTGLYLWPRRPEPPHQVFDPWYPWGPYPGYSPFRAYP